MSAGLTALTMPKWGLTMTEGKVAGWLKAEGEPVAAGEELLEIETSKITNVMEVPMLETTAEATLLRLVAPEGATLPIGGLLAVLGPADTPAGAVDAFVAGFAAAPPEDVAEAADTGAAPRLVEAGGQRIRVLEQGGGGGTPVVLVHGFGGDLDTWMFVQPALADSARTIALDLPGHGGSGRDVGAGDAAALADAVAATLDALGVARAHLVGHSLGGAVAATLAARAPERVASLALIAPAGLGPEIDGGFIDGFVAAGRRREMTELLGRLVHDPALVSRTMVEDVLRVKRLDGVAEALARIAGACFPGGRQARDLAPAIAGLAMPVLVVWGREDRIIPSAHAARAEGRAAVEVLERCGHLPHMERAAEVTMLLRRHVAAAEAA